MGLLLELDGFGGQRKGEQEIHLLLEAELRVERLEGFEVLCHRQARIFLEYAPTLQ